MSTGTACKDDTFENGITNGAYWYEVQGKFLSYIIPDIRKNK